MVPLKAEWLSCPCPLQPTPTPQQLSWVGRPAGFRSSRARAGQVPVPQPWPSALSRSRSLCVAKLWCISALPTFLCQLFILSAHLDARGQSCSCSVCVLARPRPHGKAIRTSAAGHPALHTWQPPPLRKTTLPMPKASIMPQMTNNSIMSSSSMTCSHIPHCSPNIFFNKFFK